MAYGRPERTTYRSTRPRPLGVLVAVALAVAVPVVAFHLLGGSVEHGDGGGGGWLSAGGWPPQGQAAIALGGAAPAASPDQEPAPIAKLAKVMTAYLTLERHPIGAGESGFTMTVTAAQAEAVEAEAEAGASVVPVEAGERLDERQLLEAMLIPSGNNIARMLAAGVSGGEAEFVAEMNAVASELGMDETTYTDPSGFDPGTVSTAADQLRVFRKAMVYPVFRRIVQEERATLPVAGTVVNFNPLVADGYGGKTGSDSAAGGCLAFFTHVTVGGRRKLATGVVMGQGEGDDTSELLAAAGEAAERLVGSIAMPEHRHRDLLPPRAP